MITINTRKYLRPDWPAPKSVSAFVSCRSGGQSKPPYNSFNLATHVGDNRQSVIANRNQMRADLNLPQEPFWLAQKHTTQLICADKPDMNSNASCLADGVDGSYTTNANSVLAVMTADCLPVLFCSQTMPWVAAVHAGWRGLAEGILTKTVRQYQSQMAANNSTESGKTSTLMAWIGPAISQKHFEVGAEVRAKFIAKTPANSRFFIKRNKRGDAVKYYADIVAIAAAELCELGVSVYGGNYCSYERSELFYSYRRDGETGRMASLIWINENDV